jgi:hypothetical protein
LKRKNEQIWFEKWVKKGYTVRQLTTDLAPHSSSKLRQIIYSWLDELPPSPEVSWSEVKHLIVDGKFLLGRRYCLLILFDATTMKPLAGKIGRGETRKELVPWLQQLHIQGLAPVACTLDGRTAVANSFRLVWPGITIQRCVFHVHMQVCSWARERPKYASALAIKQLVQHCLFSVQTRKQAQRFHHKFYRLTYKYREELAALDPGHPVQGDVLRAYALVRHAIPRLFEYLDDPSVARTTSALEGYFKKVQDGYGFKHAGLSRKHLFSYILWKVYFDAQNPTRKKH